MVDPRLAHIRRSRVSIVFGALDTLIQCAVATGDHTDDQRRRRAERGRTLRGVEHAEPSRRPRADIDEPAAVAKRLDEQVDPLGDPLALIANDACYGRVFGIYQVHDLETRFAVARP